MSLSDTLNEFPEVDALKDLLVAEDEHEAEQLVRDVGKRLGAANQAASAAKAKTEPQIPVRTPDERVADFVTANRTGSRAVVDPGDFWSALWDRQRPMREAEAAGDNDRPRPTIGSGSWLTGGGHKTMRRKDVEAIGAPLRNPATLAELARVSPPASPEPSNFEIRRILGAVGLSDELVAVTCGVSARTLGRWLAHGLPPHDSDGKMRLLKVVHVVRSWLAAAGRTDVEERLQIDAAPGLTAAE